MNEHTYLLDTRYSDLDTQMHVNSSLYEVYCNEARLNLLSHLTRQQKSEKTKEQTSLHHFEVIPRYSRVSYHRQQPAHAKLSVRSKLHISDSGLYLWDQKIFQDDSDLPVVELESETGLINKENKVSDDYGFKNNLEKVSIDRVEIPNQNGKCKKHTSLFAIRHIELNTHFKVPTHTLWRFNEESRWNFLEAIGLSFYDLKSKGFALFWMQGVYEYNKAAILGDNIRIDSWIGRTEGARIYIRQRAIHEETQERLMYTEGEFITVSIEKSRPVRIPEFIYKAFSDYIESNEAK